jgi:hypothetical protein
MKTYKIHRLLAILMFIVVADITTSAQEESSSTVTRITSDHGIQKWKHSNGRTDFNIEIRGEIEVTDDDKDIRSLSRDGYLQITKTVFGSQRKIIIESVGDGNFKKEYFEDRTKMSWEPNGKNWLSEILPEIIRSTTLGSQGRLNRIYAKGGASAVLTELPNLEGDYIRAHYARLLLEKNIRPKDMADVVTTIAKLVDSDYYLASVFQPNISKMLATPEAANAFYLGVQKINSDYYKSAVLKEAVDKFPASAEQVKIILQAARTIKSDYYLSVLLTALIEEDNLKEESLADLIIVSKNIPSDYYRTQVLTKALDKNDISKASLKSMIDALGGVNSDYYKSGVVVHMADQRSMDPDVQILVISLIDKTVSSDYYAAGALKSVIENQELSDEAFKQVTTAVGNLTSANYATEVFKKMAQQRMSKTRLIQYLEASAKINSDRYLSEVLVGVSDDVRSADSSVKDAYRQAAKQIRSESYYGKALKAID